MEAGPPLPLADRVAAIERSVQASFAAAQAAIEERAAVRAATRDANISDLFDKAVPEIAAEFDSALQQGDENGSERLRKLEHRVNDKLAQSNRRMRTCTRACDVVFRSWGMAVASVLCWLTGTKLVLVDSTPASGSIMTSPDRMMSSPQASAAGTTSWASATSNLAGTPAVGAGTPGTGPGARAGAAGGRTQGQGTQAGGQQGELSQASPVSQGVRQRLQAASISPSGGSSI